MLALADYEAKVHEDCGLHDSIAMTDPHVQVEDRYCPVGADLEVALRVRAHEEHEAEKDLKPGDKRASDGRTTYLRLETPAEIADSASKGR